MLANIQHTADYIKDKIGFEPSIGIVLGTGLGNLAEEISVKTQIPYSEIPSFPVTTVEGHSGALIFGELAGETVVAMQGRFHYYEGYSMQELVFPIRVMKFLGIKRLFLSNASGGVNPDFNIGDLMLMTDHINLFPGNPLIGRNIDELGPRFPDMSEPYDREMIEQVLQLAKSSNIKLQQGVYAGLSGPCLETPAEYEYVRRIGADTVGMSTVPEVIAAVHMGIPCMAISVITDIGVKGRIVKVTHEDVQREAAKAEPKLTLLVKELIKSLEVQ